MIRPIRTYSDAYLRRHRETHANHPAFGTHRHPYLLDTMRELAKACELATGAPPSVLDYGCGKGVFLEELRATGLFGDLVGHDPAIARFRERPARQFDIVVCLDVLDQLEDAFVRPAIEDVAQFSARVAVFDIITRQSPRFAHLRPRSASTWLQRVERSMRPVSSETRVATPWEIAMEGACPERVIIVAGPKELPVS
jgi:2-polyprenyl-3-methyl-5-hydroxy-6-metoxy-1,4-benzoquinol methylase